MLLVIFELIYIIRSLKISYQSKLRIKDEIRDLLYEGFQSVALNIQNISLTIINCTFLSNSANDMNPGAITVTTSLIVTIDESIFENNTGMSEGGAIYIDAKTFKITNSSFINNLCYTTTETTESKGGAIFIKCQVDSEQTFESCLFTKNMAKTSGGSIFIDFTTYSYKSVLISNCLFNESESDQKGGAINLLYQDMANEITGETSIFCSIFEHCHAYTGGSLYLCDLSNIKTDKKTISNCTFVNSTSNSNGSAIYSEINYLNIINCNFSLCQTREEGTVYINTTFETFESYFDSNILTNCTSKNGGSLSIHCENEIDSYRQISIENCIFKYCIAELNGGAINAIGNLATSIHNCDFNDNEVKQYGGAIYSNVQTVNINRCHFINCKAFSDKEESRGGAVYLDRSLTRTLDYMEKNVFNLCESYCGGALFIKDIDMDCIAQILECNFSRCQSVKEGGAISNGEIGTDGQESHFNYNIFHLSFCLFLECESRSGGALFFQDGSKKSDEETKILSCRFMNCFASGGEGYAISCRSYKAEIDNNTFFNHNRTASDAVGVIVYLEFNDESLIKAIFDRNVFEDNFQISGLQINITKASAHLTLNDNKFLNYKDDGLFGGTFSSDIGCINFDYWVSPSTSIILNGFEFNNIKNMQCIRGTKAQISGQISNCNFTNISYKSLTGGPCGSCIYLPFLAPNINERRNIDIHFCIFINIESNGEGGAIYANCEVTGIQNNQFYNCRTSSENGNDQGGAIFLDAQSICSQEYIAGCLFEDCSSTNSGGAIFANCIDLEENNRRSTRANDYYKYAIMIGSCNFTRCHTKVRGGAISSGIQTEENKSGGNDFIIRSCYFVECESGSGGALYFLDGTEDGDEQTCIGYCTFINCFASGGEGYAISCRSYNAYLINNTFKEHKRGANNATHSILYIQMNEEVTPYLFFLTFEDNTGVSGLKLITASSVTVSYFTFQNYADFTPCVNLDQWIITNADTQVILDNWQFTNISESRCIYMSEHKLFKAVIQNSYFNDTVIKFSNSLYSHNSDGSCILCHKSGNIEVTSCHFTNALAHGSGGAIYAESQSIDIKKCTFTNCHTADDSDDYKGGAIYIDSKTAADHEYLQDNIFENCSSSFSGGAIFIFCSDVNKTSPDYNPSYDKAYQIYQCNFTNCRSTTEGGAICIGETNPDGSTVGTNDIGILNCFFTDCQSGRGGAIKAQDGTKSGDEQTSIYFCTFTNCIAKEGEGYAISCRSYMISMYYLSFYDHKSSKNDKTHSIVYIEMNEADTTPALRDFTYECNSGVSSIILFSASSTILSNFTFRNYEDTIPCINLDEWSLPGVNNILEGFKFHNIVNARCIAMTQDKISATVTGSEFINISHRSTKLSLNKGGSSIYIANNESLILKNNIRIRDCKFINNQAESQGGSIYGESQAIDIEFCQFINCHATSEDELRTDAGGAIFLLGIKAIGREFIQANIFEDCSAGYSGGAIFIYGRDLEESGSLIKDEDPDKYAIIFFDCSFTRCKSGVEGGAVSRGINYGESDNSVDAYGDNDIGFSLCNFTDCESGKGGALYFQNGDADGDEITQISVCIFTNCTAREGQGYSISCQSYKLTITVCTFKEHKRSAINNSHCILYIKMDEREVTSLLNYLTFEDNAGVSSLTLKIANSVALDNFIFNNYHLSEYSQSQCIDLDSWSIQGSVTFDNCNFTNIDNLQCITSIDIEFIANIYKCEFINISTQLLSYTGIKHYGACISSRTTKGNIFANETIFKNVTVSNGHGGAIFAFVESIDITACKFYSCHVSSKLNESQEDVSAQGGAIYLDATTGETIETITNCLFENCSSTYSGGAIFAYCFDQNATSGFKLLTIRIENCNFSYCKSEVEGGAISSGVKLGDKPVEGDDDIIIYKCYFVGCESGRGGAIFSQDGTKSGDEQTTIYQCQFINCFAREGEGYAISCRSYKITMYNLEFKEHKRDAKSEKQSIVYIEMNEADQAPTISLFTYENNSGV